MKYKCITCKHIWVSRTDKKPKRCSKCHGSRIIKAESEPAKSEQDIIQNILIETLKDSGLKDPKLEPFDYAWTKVGEDGWTHYGKATVFLEKGEEPPGEMYKTAEIRKNQAGFKKKSRITKTKPL